VNSLDLPRYVLPIFSNQSHHQSRALDLCPPPLSPHLATMAANRDMIEVSMVVAGFCINQHGGAYVHGKSRPLQDKALVAQKYFDLEENLLAGQHISVLSLAKASSVSWGFAKKL
jgi:hypothetical protein